MDHARAILNLEEAATETEFIEVLKNLTVTLPKTLSKEISVKISGSKAELIVRIVPYWERYFTIHSESKEEAADTPSNSKQKSFEDICSWGKDLDCLADFNLVHLYNYLVHSRDKTFDKESMKAFKSLKAYKYFSEGLIQNVWIHQDDDTPSIIVIRAHCFSSLKSKVTYTVYATLKTTGDVVSAVCKCVAGRGGACSHIAVLLFYVEDIKRRDGKILPSDRTVTDTLQQWHVPPKRNVTPTAITNISFQKPAYGKTPQPQKPPSVQQCKPSSGLTHFWPEFDTLALNSEEHGGTEAELTEPVETEVIKPVETEVTKPVEDKVTEPVEDDAIELMETSVDEGLRLLAKKLVIYSDNATSLPQSAVELHDRHPRCLLQGSL